ncbi:MAG: hypothetical protein AAF340_10615 [Pseudomonadota bacterium]
MTDLPPLALSVRQPWAWAILHCGKIIENRTKGSIRAGRMTTGPIAIHAATGMKQEEYRWAAWKLRQIGVSCPMPADLPRRAIIGMVDVVDIITESDSPWFGGPCGLVLENPRAVTPIPAAGALGYFEWAAEGALDPPKPWMQKFQPEPQSEGLFPELELSFKKPPAKPYKPKP